MPTRTINAVLSAKDREVNVAVAVISRATNEFRIAIRQEPDYGIYLLADCPDGTAKSVVYRVTDSLEPAQKNHLLYLSYQEAHGFYCELVGSGSWAEHAKETAMVAALEVAGLYATGHEICRKGDGRSLGRIVDGEFMENEFCCQINTMRLREIRAAVKRFMEVQCLDNSDRRGYNSDVL